MLWPLILSPNPEQATAQLYEQGGLNHDMSFFLTAVAFFSMERPDMKVCMASPRNVYSSILRRQQIFRNAAD